MRSILARLAAGEGFQRGLLARAQVLASPAAVAEGVETEAQVALLQRLRCDEIQGFLVSPALPAEQFEQLVRARTPLQIVA